MEDKEQALTYVPFMNEGFGSIFQYILTYYFFCKDSNKKFEYTPIKGFQHSVHNNMGQEEWDKLLNKFITDYFIPDLTLSSSNQTQPSYVKKDFLDFLLRNNPGIMEPFKKYFRCRNTLNIKNYFNKDVINVGIHVRVFSSTDFCDLDRRELYQKESQIDKYYQCCLKEIINLFPERKIDIHVYSQHTSFDHWNHIRTDNVNIITHFGNDLISDIYHMINCDIFVASKSSLSAMVNYYREGITIIRKGFWHTLINCVYTDMDCSFSDEEKKKIVNSVENRM